jgi:transcriptional regulator with XRE-family HTH domain
MVYPRPEKGITGNQSPGRKKRTPLKTRDLICPGFFYGGKKMDLKEARKAVRLTQTQMAERLNITQGQFCQWERGNLTPTSQQRKEMDKILVNKVEWEAQFEPLDQLEQAATLRFAGYLIQEINEDAAIRLVFRNSKYHLRQMLKANGYLPKDYTPGVKPLLPPGVKEDK